MKLRSEPIDTHISRTDTALLVVDCQRDFLEKGGFAESGLQVDITEAREIIPRIASIIEACRRKGVAVVYMREAYGPDLDDLTVDHSWYEFIGKTGAGGWKYLIYGERGHEIVPELAPFPGEYVVDKAGKNGVHDLPPMSAANQNTLVDVLGNKLGVKTVITTGVATSVCVDETARGMKRKGFLPVLTEDCCGDYDRRKHEATLISYGRQQQKGDGLYGRVTGSEYVLEAIDGL